MRTAAAKARTAAGLVPNLELMSSQPLPEPDPYITTDGPILSERFKDPEGTWLEGYVAAGGYEAAKKAVADQIKDDAKKVHSFHFFDINSRIVPINSRI